MNTWQKAYDSHTFEITTDQPSTVVRRGIADLEKRTKLIADLGAGAGRNTRFIASKGFHVQARDIADIGLMDSLPNPLQPLVDFTIGPVEEFSTETGLLDGVVLARLIQYISPESLPEVLEACYHGLRSGGRIMLNYTYAGGAPLKEELGIERYEHSPMNIFNLLSSFTLLEFAKREGRSIHTNYDYPNSTMEIIAEKP